MLLAYLRGFLTPNAPQGLRSDLRERLIFDALMAEASADFESKMVQLESAFAVHMKPQAVKNQLQELQCTLIHCRNIRAFDWHNRPTAAAGSVDSLFKLYHAMEKAGLLTPD